jgi:putative membrane protein
MAYHLRRLCVWGQRLCPQNVNRERSVKIEPRRTLMTITAAGALVFATPTLSYAQGASSMAQGWETGLRQVDETAFLRTAVSDSATEIEAGELAQNRAGTDVREFAERLIDEHQDIMEDAARVAADNGVNAPRRPTDEDEIALIDDLEGVSGDDFDETYLRAFIQDQRATISDYEDARSNASDDVADFADRQIETLESQLREAEDLAERLDIEVDES